jgi:hypothetical protein
MKKDEVPDYWTGGEREAKSAESGGTGVVVYSYENGWKLKVTAKTSYQKMIKEVVDWYACHYQKSA